MEGRHRLLATLPGNRITSAPLVNLRAENGCERLFGANPERALGAGGTDLRGARAARQAAVAAAATVAPPPPSLSLSVPF